MIRTHEPSIHQLAIDERASAQPSELYITCRTTRQPPTEQPYDLANPIVTDSSFMAMLHLNEFPLGNSHYPCDFNAASNKHSNAS